jgi:hypothetical protein
MDKNIKEREVIVGEGTHGYGVVALKLKTLIKTRFANKVITFEKKLEIKVVILLCYGK